jgi:hypothetical protein
MMSKTPWLSRWTSHRPSPTFILLGIGLLGLLARVWVVKHSLGSNDMLTWWSFATEIDQHGLAFAYDNDPRFNHPPLMGLLVSLLHALAAKTGVRFDVLFKTPELLADVGAAALIYWIWRRRSARYAALAVALFCWNPASLLVSAYHGNTDPLCAALTLAAVLLVDSKRPLLAGLALGASINVKLIPVLLIPVLYSCVGGWRQAARFTAGLSFGVLPFVPVVLYFSLWTGSQPFYSNFYVGHPMGAQVVGYLAWMVLIRTAIELLRAERQPPLLSTGNRGHLGRADGKIKVSPSAGRPQDQGVPVRRLSIS